MGAAAGVLFAGRVGRKRLHSRLFAPFVLLFCVATPANTVRGFIVS